MLKNPIVAGAPVRAPVPNMLDHIQHMMHKDVVKATDVIVFGPGVLQPSVDIRMQLERLERCCQL